MILAALAAAPFLLAATPAQGAGTNETRASPEVAIDLAAEPMGRLELAANQGQPFDVRLVNLAPSGSYRVTADWSVAKGNPTPPDKGLHRTFDIPRPGRKRVQRLPFGVQPCDALQDRAHELLDSAQEAEAASRLGALEQETIPDKCRAMIRLLMDEARPRLPTTYTLHDGDVLIVTVDRLDPASRRVVRTWKAAIRPVATGRARWPRAGEEEWAIAEILLDIAEMLRFGRDGSIPDPGQVLTAIAQDPGAAVLAYKATIDAGRSVALTDTIAIGRHLWAPEAYEGIARSLLQRTSVRRTRRRARTDVLEALLEPTGAILRREARRVSERLRTSMTDGEAHLDAALVLGAFALREPDGEFADCRSTLCRMTAHLALSLALRGPGPGAPGEQVAQAVLATLVGRQREAVDRLEAIEAGGSSATCRAWARALRLRSTHDWRTLAQPESASLLERLAYFREVRTAAGSARAEDFLARRPGEPVPDWGWLALGGGNATVGEGSRYADLNPTQEELAEAWAEYAAPGDAGEPPLDVRAERCVVRQGSGGAARIEVIGWGRWAEFYERQLGLVMVREEEHLGRMVFAEEAASRFRRESAATLGRIASFPVVQTRWRDRLVDSNTERDYHLMTEPAVTGDDIDDQRACRAFSERVQRSPEALTLANWTFMRSMCALDRDRGLLPGPGRWFSSGLPAGTTYDVGARFEAWDELGVQNPDAEALRRIAPFSLPILWYSARRRHSDSPNAAELEAALRPLTSYDVRAMRSVAAKSYDDPPQHTRWLRAIAELSPSSYLALGRYLSDRDMDEEAAAAFEKAIALAPDRVTVSQSLDWLVDFYFDGGKNEDALRVARYGAGVSSALGLLTMARVMERLGNLESARDWQERTMRAYDVKTHLLRFFLRQEQRHPGGRFASEAREAERELFREGLLQFGEESIDGEPAAGQAYVVSAPDLGERERRLGLRVGDRVVAVDGFRVRDERQYHTVLTFRDEPNLTLVLWRDGSLVTVNGYYRRYRYGAARPR
jgi:hypothetical protein